MNIIMVKYEDTSQPLNLGDWMEDHPQSPHLPPHIYKREKQGFPGGSVVKNPPANAGHTGSNPGPGRSHMPWSN